MSLKHLLFKGNICLYHFSQKKKKTVGINFVFWLCIQIAISSYFHRPYAGDFVPDDPQRRLDLLKPRLANGECPPGFLGFAVNMINVDTANLFCVTANGHGLRETLFYNLFSRLQVYKTRVEMLNALPCISDGALSLDGGMIRATGVFSLGNR